jgi:hypothetical protein
MVKMKGVRKLLVGVLAVVALVAADYFNLDATTRVLLTTVAVTHLGIQGAIDLTEVKYEEPISVEYRRE